MLGPDKALEVAVQRFEARFEHVEVYQSGDPHPSAHNGVNQYITMGPEGPRQEGHAPYLYDCPWVAVRAYRNTLYREHERHGAPKRLYWRSKPTLEYLQTEMTEGWAIWSRLTFG